MSHNTALSRKTYSSEGFVIGRRKFGEADRILVLFTKDFGKKSFIAKGVRKLTSRKRGGIEIFSQIKFSGVHSGSLDIITEVEVVDSYNAIRTQLNRVSVAYFFCEVIGRVTQDEQKHLEVFDILKKYFYKLETSRNLKKLRQDYIAEVLTAIGFWPKDKKMVNADAVLESVTERQMSSFRVGKRMLQK